MNINIEFNYTSINDVTKQSLRVPICIAHHTTHYIIRYNKKLNFFYLILKLVLIENTIINIKIIIFV